MSRLNPNIAIIGTAGRDKTKPMTEGLWHWMVAQALELIPEGSNLISGGAAWADHVACELYRLGHAASLHLHLPAPFVNGRFQGPSSSSANTANYYHELFTQAINRFTLHDITLCIKHGATYDCEPEAPGYAAMFKRNKKIAKADNLLAFTWGIDEPAPGGTKDTWDQCLGQRKHVSLMGYQG